jgi:hypothetical protein
MTLFVYRLNIPQWGDIDLFYPSLPRRFTPA